MGAEKDATLLRETYAAHQIFMNLGYQADEIFVGIMRGIGETVTGQLLQGRLCLIVQLKRGGRTFTLLIAPITPKQGKRFRKTWDDFARRGKRAASVAELDEMLYGSQVFARRDLLLRNMAEKGFSLDPQGAYFQ